MMREKIKVILKEYVENNEKIEDNTLNELFNDCVKKIYKSYKKIYGHEPDIPEIYLKFDDNFKDGKIGAFIHPNHKNEHGIMLIKPKAIEDGGEDYVKDIILHELIHAVLGHSNHEHDEDFHRMADLVDLPEEYRD
jgi:hypothetical protein